ncbi:MAG: LysR family transcriptional regulator [Oscillospiraceae bacterium]|nr:LysR family transcriptional regulator [Oscillospiraceae bacterium]
MDTARCKAFVAAVRSGSFSRAAEELHYTTSAVSQLITALEEDLQVPLFIRSRKGVTLTADGERLYPTIYNLVRQEEKVYETASEISGLIVGEIRISAFYSICSTWLPGLITRFQEHYPGVKFKIDDSIRRYVLDALNTGRADLGFLSDHHDFAGEWVDLELNPMMAVVSKDSPYAALDAFPVWECDHAPIIQPSHGRDLDIIEIFNKYNLSPTIVYTTRNSITAAAMANNNMGVLLVNELSTRLWSFDVKVMPLDPPQYISLGMAVPPGSLTSPAVKTFVRFVRDAFES